MSVAGTGGGSAEGVRGGVLIARRQTSRTTSGYEESFDDLGVSSVCKGPTHDEIP